MTAPTSPEGGDDAARLLGEKLAEEGHAAFLEWAAEENQRRDRNELPRCVPTTDEELDRLARAPAIDSEQEMQWIAGDLGIPIAVVRSEVKRRRKALARQEHAPREMGQRERVIEIGMDSSLWHDPDGNGFATIEVDGHREHYAVRSRQFARRLVAMYCDTYSSTGPQGETRPAAPSTQALREGIAALDAQCDRGPEHEPRVRVGEHAGRLYLDLGRREWNAVEVDVDGWRVIDAPPVKFLRPPGLRPLPVPHAGGNVELLRPFVNLAGDADFMLVVGWLVAALSPRGPYPVLIVNGEQGSAKTTLSRVLRRLVDPNQAEARSAPRDERDLVIAARNGHMIVLDNLSTIDGALADAMCRIATGAGFSTRTLYTDTDETIIAVSRPQIANGIPDLATRPDLADRAIALLLPPLVQFRTEAELWRDFETAAPQILGALLDALACALSNHDSVRLARPPRMADFATWVEAAAPAIGWQAGEFVACYEGNRRAAVETTIEADAIAVLVRELITRESSWAGTARDLFTLLNQQAGADIKQAKGWPSDPARLGNRLRRAAPGLRHLGIEVTFRDQNRRRGRIIELTSGPKMPSAPSAPSAGQPSEALAADSGADGDALGAVRSNALGLIGIPNADSTDGNLLLDAGSEEQWTA